MSEERSARVRSAISGRVLKSLLLAAAFICAFAQTPAGRAGAPRPSVAAAPQVAGTGGVGLIAFEAGGAIYVVDAGGGTPRRIVAPKADVTNMQPALSPDGTRIAFSSNREGLFSIYVIGTDGEGLRRITNGPDSEPAWSPDGTKIAFARGFDATGNGVYVLTCEATSDIVVADVDAYPHTEVNLTNGLRATDPAWSPDGKRIAFASDSDGFFDIYVMFSDDGGGVQKLTDNDWWADADPAWSPDGSYIAYTTALRIAGGTQCGNMPISGVPAGGGVPGGVTGDGGPFIYTMQADGKSHKALTVEGGAAGPSWSPDGTQIVFAGGYSDSEDVQLYQTATASGGQRWIQLTYGRSQKSSPSWGYAPGR